MCKKTEYFAVIRKYAFQQLANMASPTTKVVNKERRVVNRNITQIYAIRKIL